jgi:hypothetical protein
MINKNKAGDKIFIFNKFEQYWTPSVDSKLMFPFLHVMLGD